MLLDPEPKRNSTVLLKWGDEVLQQLQWNGRWMRTSLSGQTVKVLPMKARKGISYRIIRRDHTRAQVGLKYHKNSSELETANAHF